jgi:hypothetical protein
MIKREPSASLDNTQRQLEALYEVHREDDPPEQFPLFKRQAELAGRIRGMRVHAADGILAIARSIAVHNSHGGSISTRGVLARLSHTEAVSVATRRLGALLPVGSVGAAGKRRHLDERDLAG